MNRTLHRIAVIGILAVAATGCAMANNKTSVTSRSNIGLDLDSPPVRLAFAVSSAREITTPTFEGAQTLPTLSGMSTQGDMFDQFFNGLSQTLATGDAAFIMSHLYTDCTTGNETIPNIPAVKLTRKPKIDAHPTNVRPAVITSRSLVGMRMAWTDNVPLIASSIQAGFTRKGEIATPILAEFNSEAANTPYTVTVPSFMGTVDKAADLAQRSRDSEEKPLEYVQFFAIGKSAEDLARRDDVRLSLFKRLLPELKKTSCP